MSSNNILNNFGEFPLGNLQKPWVNQTPAEGVRCDQFFKTEPLNTQFLKFCEKANSDVLGDVVDLTHFLNLKDIFKPFDSSEIFQKLDQSLEIHNEIYHQIMCEIPLGFFEQFKLNPLVANSQYYIPSVEIKPHVLK